MCVKTDQMKIIYSFSYYEEQSKLCYFLYVTILRNYKNLIMHLFIYLFIFCDREKHALTGLHTKCGT